MADMVSSCEFVRLFGNGNQVHSIKLRFPRQLRLDEHTPNMPPEVVVLCQSADTWRVTSESTINDESARFWAFVVSYLVAVMEEYVAVCFI